MEYTNSKIVTLDEYKTIYSGDSINIHDELTAEFKLNNPNALMSVAAGELIDIDNDNFRYDISIIYEI